MSKKKFDIDPEKVLIFDHKGAENQSG